MYFVENTAESSSITLKNGIDITKYCDILKQTIWRLYYDNNDKDENVHQDIESTEELCFN